MLGALLGWKFQQVGVFVFGVSCGAILGIVTTHNLRALLQPSQTHPVTRRRRAVQATPQAASVCTNRSRTARVHKVQLVSLDGWCLNSV